MSNRSIANDLIDVLEDFKAARVSATDVEDAVERAVQAMENVSLRAIHRSRDLASELVEAALNDESEGASLGPEVAVVLESLRNYVAALGKRDAT